MNNKTKTIDAYIRQFPDGVQTQLQKLRKLIAKAAPKAEEAMKYGIPTFSQDGNPVHFGGFKGHIGFYPAPGGINEFKIELAPYIAGKGSLKFELGKPFPATLITKVVKFRIRQNAEKKRAR